MFVDAIKVATGFTRHVIIATRHLDESLTTDWGAFVVLNKDGWALTVAHLFKSFADAQQHEPLVKKYRAEVAAVEGDTSLNAKRKAKKVQRIKSDPKWITAHAMWWSRNNVEHKEIRALGGIDLAVVRLEPWDAAWVKSYAKIKDPTKNVRPGRSLCRLGYPFANIKTNYDETTRRFAIESKSAPFFPLDGIYTRNVAPKRKANGYNVKFLETSSPGLRGQSGGPIFDVQGTVWAIQSGTDHHELGFSPKAEKGRSKTVEHQFLNVGLGVHPEVIVAFLRDNGIDFQLSDY